MKFEQLLNMMKAHNEKIEEQWGEIFQEDVDNEKEIEQSLEDWVRYFIIKLREKDSEAEACKNLAKLYTEKAQEHQKKSDYYRKGIFTLIDHNGSPVKTDIGSARIQQGIMQVKLNVDAEFLPVKYQKVTYSADKIAIKKDIQSGDNFDFAILERGNPFVVIK